MYFPDIFFQFVACLLTLLTVSREKFIILIKYKWSEKKKKEQNGKTELNGEGLSMLTGEAGGTDRIIVLLWDSLICSGKYLEKLEAQ